MLRSTCSRCGSMNLGTAFNCTHCGATGSVPLPNYTPPVSIGFGPDRSEETILRARIAELEAAAVVAQKRIKHLEKGVVFWENTCKKITVVTGDEKAAVALLEMRRRIAELEAANAEHMADGEFGRLATKYLIENHPAEYDAAHHYAEVTALLEESPNE